MLDRLTPQKQVVGSVRDRLTSTNYTLLGKACGDHSHFPEFKLDLVQDDKLLGYSKFVSGIYSPDGLAMSALLTDEQVRGRGLANLLLEVLFQYGSYAGFTFTAATPQRKPLTAFVLQKFGFEPMASRKLNTVDIYGRLGCDALSIAFRSEVKRQQFERSRLCEHSEQYVVVSPEMDPIDTVSLLSIYTLEDAVKCMAKRREVQKRFIVKIDT